MSHLTQTMVEQFFEVEKENARCVLRKEMDSCMDTIFKQMKRKLMMLVATQEVKTEIVEEHDDFGAHEQQHSSSNPILSTTNNSHDQNIGSQHGDDDDDEIIVTNELGEIIDIVPDESIPPISTHSQNEQSNENDIMPDDFDEVLEDCDCPDCIGDVSIKKEVDDDQTEVQLNENPVKNLDSDSRPTKRPRFENAQKHFVPSQFRPSLKANYNYNYNNYNQVRLNRPINNWPIPQNLNCPKCSQKLNDTKSLHEHMKTHPIGLYDCTFKECLYVSTFTNKIELDHHYSTTHYRRVLSYSFIPGNRKTSQFEAILL